MRLTFSVVSDILFNLIHKCWYIRITVLSLLIVLYSVSTDNSAFTPCYLLHSVGTDNSTTLLIILTYCVDTDNSVFTLLSF